MVSPTKELRNSYKIKRESLDKNSRSEYESAVVQKILNILDEIKLSNVLCFYPTGSEINLFQAYKILLSAGKHLFFPVTKNGMMEFFEIHNLEEDFELGQFNIMVPKQGLKKYSYELCGASACICPGLIFDKALNRVGYGKGFYDRYLGQKDFIYKIGACFEIQIIDELEAGPFDQKMDLIITENNIYRGEK